MTTTKDNAVLVDDDAVQNEAAKGPTEPPRRKKSVFFRGFILEGFNIIIVATVGFCFAVTLALVITIFAGQPQLVPHGAVQSLDKTCSDIGADLIRKRNGNAIDATAAVILCLTLIRPDLASAFGCGAIMVHDRDSQETKLYDFMCYAPKGYKDLLDQPTENRPLSLTGVPELLPTIISLQHSAGILSWQDIVLPILNLIDSGWYFSPELVKHAQSIPSARNSQLIQSILAKGSNSLYRPPAQTVAFYKKLYSFTVQSFNENYNLKLVNIMLQDKLHWDFTNDILNFSSYVKNVDSIKLAGFKLLAFPPPFMSSAYTGLLLKLLDLSLTTNPISWVKLHANTDKETTAAFLNRMATLAKFALAKASLSGDMNDATVGDQVTNNYLNALKMEELLAIVKQVDDKSTVADEAAFGSVKSFPENVLSGQQSIGDSSVIVTDPDRFTVLTSLVMGKPLGNAYEMESTGQLLNSVLGLFQSKNKENLNVIAGGRRPLVPTGPFYLHADSRKCGIRVGVAASGGLQGMFDSAQVAANAIYFAQGAGCLVQMATVPAPNYPINVSPEDKSFPDSGSGSNALRVSCLPASQALSLARIGPMMDQGQNLNPTLVVERGFSEDLASSLESKQWNITKAQTDKWPSSTGIVGWSGYNLIAYGDSRSSSSFATSPF